jgi:serine/threonine-protein kinase
MSESTNDRVGETFGPYRLDSLLGRGGMGEVYRAYDTNRQRDVALKLLTMQYAQDPSFQERFRRECQTLARLDEPHVIPIHDFGEIDSTLFLDMRLVNGRDLRAILRERGTLSPADAVGLIEQVAAALDAAHAAGLVHRDVKPENILVTGANFAYLVDFGVAHADNDTHLTKTGTAVGSVAYMSPEQFEATPVTAASDVYSLTVVLFEMLTGRQPYPGESISTVMRGILFDETPSASAVNPDVTPEMDAVVAWGLHRDPAGRCPSALELAAAARKALAGEAPPVAAAAPTSLTKSPGSAPATLAAPSPIAPPPPPPPPDSPTVISNPQTPTADRTMVAGAGYMQQHPGPQGTANVSGPQVGVPYPSGPHPSGPHPSGPQPVGPNVSGPVPYGYPGYPPAPAPSSGGSRRTNMVLAAVVVLLVGALAGVGGWLVVDQLGGNDDDVSSAAVTTDTTAATQPTAAAPTTVAPTTPTYVPAAPPPDNQPCPGATGVGTGYPQWTGCEFAINVRDAYVAGGPLGQSRVVNGWAPQQRKYYVMSCDPYAGIIACRGGNQAVVYVY